MPSLSLQQGNPSPTADAAGGTIYFVPHQERSTEIYDGSAWQLRPYAGELSLALNATAHPASTGFDLFEFWDGSAVQIGTGPAWSTDVTRSAAVESLDGTLVNSAAISVLTASGAVTVGARQVKLRGGFRTTTAGQTADTQRQRLVSDLFNPRQRSLARTDSADTWMWSSTFFHQANANALNQVEVFSAAGGGAVWVRASGYMINLAGYVVSGFVGVGVNSTTADSSQMKNPSAGSNTFPILPGWADYVGQVPLGFTRYVWLERGNGGSQMWVGDNGYGGYGYGNGLVGQVFL